MPEQPSVQLARGLRAGNLALIRAAARELEPLPLGVAFEVLMLINRREASRWPRASARWLGRVAADHDDVALADVATLVHALIRLDEGGAQDLRTLDRRLRLGLDHGLALWPAASSRAPRDA